MPLDYLPSRDADLAAWTVNFSNLIAAAPTDYGLDATQATTFGGLTSTYQTALQTSLDPSTRTPSSIVTKNNAKTALIENSRELAAIVQASPGVTDTQKTDLGLTVRDDEPTPVPVPTEAPAIDIVSVNGWTVNVRLHDPKSPTTRGKPAGVQGASVFSFVGEDPPVEIGGWKFEGSITRTTIDVEFPATVLPGTKVWITAFWYNPRAQSGPATTPVSTFTNHGGLAAAA